MISEENEHCPECGCRLYKFYNSHYSCYFCGYLKFNNGEEDE